MYGTKAAAERVLAQLPAVHERGESDCAQRAAEDAAAELEERYTMAHWTARCRLATRGGC